MNNFQQVNQNQQHELLPFGSVQHNLSDIMPMCSEIGHLWASYIAESMSVCMLKHFVGNSKDPDIHPILQRALDIASQRIQTMEDIFNSFQHPIPEAFGDKDVDVNAKQLYGEPFTLIYTRLMNKFILINYSYSLSVSSRSDFRNYFMECITTTQEIHQKATDVLLAKGILSKYPNIAIPDRVDYVHDKNYLGSFWGSKRPLNALEITHIVSLIEINFLLRAINLGFSQVVKSDKVRNFLSQCKQVADNHLKVLGSFLEDEDLPQPPELESLITDSKESLFSEKLILTHATTSLAFIIAGYGLAVTNTARKDLTLAFSRLAAEKLELSKDGVELMIESGWLERVPETADRKDLIH